MKNYIAIYSILYDISLERILEVLNIFFEKKNNISIIENGSSIDYEDEKMELSSEPYPLDDITINETTNHLLTWNYHARLAEGETFIKEIIEVLEREKIVYRFDYEVVNINGESISKEYTIMSEDIN